jgi:hypothetical protein
VGTKAERQAASKSVAAWYEAQLADLIEYITAAADRYRAGEIDAYAVDQTIHHYHRAARAKPSTGRNGSHPDNATGLGVGLTLRPTTVDFETWQGGNRLPVSRTSNGTPNPSDCVRPDRVSGVP